MRQIEINTFNQFLTEAGIRDEYMTQFTNNRNTQSGDFDSFMLSSKTSNLFTDGFNQTLLNDPEWIAAMNLWEEYKKDHPISKNRMKFCPCCWTLKSLESFDRNAQDKSGYFTYCKDCGSPVEYGKKHPNEIVKGSLSSYECILIDGRIYLNMKLSLLVKEKGFRHCGLRHQDGKLFLIFCEKNSEKNMKFYKNGGIAVASNKVIDDIIKSLNITFTDPVHLHVTTNKAIKPSAVTIEILQGISHEEYTKHPFTKNKGEETKLSSSKTEDSPIEKDSNSVSSPDEMSINKESAEDVSFINSQEVYNSYDADDQEYIAHNTPKPVLQLNPETLEVIKRWPNANYVMAKLGIFNVGRSIKRHSLCGGFYWCYPGEEEDFKPTASKKSNPSLIKKDIPVKKRSYTQGCKPGYERHTYYFPSKMIEDIRTLAFELREPESNLVDRILEKGILEIQSKDSQTNSGDSKINDLAKVIHFLKSDDSTYGMMAILQKMQKEPTINPQFSEYIKEMEDAFARALKFLGWKLQRPVKIIKYEEF